MTGRDRTVPEGTGERPLTGSEPDSIQSTKRREPPLPCIRQIGLAIDPAGFRRIHLDLAERLARATGAQVSFRRCRSVNRLPATIDLLLGLERMLDRTKGARLSDRIEWSEEMERAAATADPPDLVIDLCGAADLACTRTFRVRYDRSTEEAALFGALLAGRMPSIEIEDVASGEVLTRGVPCADNAGSLLGALEGALPRLVDLAVAAALGWAMLAAPPRPAGESSGKLRELVGFEMRTLGHALARRLYHLCCYAPHWRTCWRFVDGADLWQNQSLTGSVWNIIPDPGYRFYADPFPITHDGETLVFVEDFDHRAQRGRISAVPFNERGPAGPARPVLEEPWHLSYPHVFALDNEVWMIPESSERRSVILYRGAPFPYRWVREAILLDGIDASDATIVRHAGRFWLFTVIRDGAGSWSDKLSIFSAANLRGPWRPHSGNPVVIDQATARPGGAFVHRGGRLWRPVQDCSAGYGTGIGLLEVTRLDDAAYEQRRHAVLRADVNWPGRRFHTLNRAGRLEVIDGSAHSPRSRLLARRLENWSGRRELAEAGATPDFSHVKQGRVTGEALEAGPVLPVDA